MHVAAAMLAIRGAGAMLAIQVAEPVRAATQPMAADSLTAGLRKERPTVVDNLTAGLRRERPTVVASLTAVAASLTAAADLTVVATTTDLPQDTAAELPSYAAFLRANVVVHATAGKLQWA